MHSSTGTEEPRVRFGLAFAGFVLVLGAAFGLLPAAMPAILLSDDGVLSPAFTATLRGAQQAAGWILVVAGLAWRSWTSLAAAAARIRDRQLHTLLPIAAGLLSFSCQQFLFGGIPHITDATSHVFQARILARFALAAPLPPCHEAFFQHNVIMSPDGLWHTKYFPGHALWLAPFELVGLLPLAMPIAAGITVWALIGGLKRIYDDRTASIAGALMAVSPQFALLGGSYMSHMTFLMCAALAFRSIVRDADAGRISRVSGFLAGLWLGAAGLTRPQDLAVPAVAIGAVCLLRPRTIRLWITAAPWIFAGAAPALVVLAGWNFAMYGSALASGYNFDRPVSLTPIIRDSLGFTDHHTPARALRHAVWTLTRLDTALFGWPGGIVMSAAGIVRRRIDFRDVIAAATVAATIGLYMLFPYYGRELEARYYVTALPGLALLAARFLRSVSSQGSPLRFPRASAVILMFALHSLFHYIPAKIVPEYSGAYEQADPLLAELTASITRRPALVLIPSAGPGDFRYSSGFARLDPWLEADVLYARETDLECLAREFPGRTIYRISGGGLPGDGSLIEVGSQLP